MNRQSIEQKNHNPVDHSLSLPCLLPEGTGFFAPTADQRFLFDPEAFLRTHFPMQLSHRRASYTMLVTEEDLLHSLAHSSSNVVGNRVFLLYGAAGSGKSELLRWLQTQLQQRYPDRFAVTTRIARTELDIGHIAQRFRHFYHQPPLQQETLQRWEEARKKPRTVAKLLALTALEQLLHSDEQVNALYYQLIDVIQTNLERYFKAMEAPVEGLAQNIELLSREDVAALLRESAIPLSLDYETLRHTLLKIFRDLLLEGLDLPGTLKNIAEHMQQSYRQRPILLIDDLVQSIHLFATDLLDYFITLEEGCWDVIIGITPNSLDATARGKELLTRITYLDTIDDRVQKLWLSDEYGLSSSFLDETNCVEYARLYLNEYKQHNHCRCDSSCTAFHRCHALDPARNEMLLAPFNKALLIRLFRSLPPNKGKVRYFTLALQDILQRTAQGEPFLSVLHNYVQSELAVYHSNVELARCYQLYGPCTGEAQTSSPDSQGIFAFFAFPSLDDEQPVIISLTKKRHGQEPAHSLESKYIDVDAGKEAVKHWLAGEPVNKQQLRHLRRGIVKAMKDGYAIDTMMPLYTAKSSHVLRWTQTRLDTVPPVVLEGVDDFDGILIERALGSLCYILYDFADASGAAEQQLHEQLLTHSMFPTLLFRAIAYREQQLKRLEKYLGMHVEELACVLLRIALFLGHCPLQLPPAIVTVLEEPQVALRYPERLEAERPRLAASQLAIIKRLCEDCFKLRENVFDGMRLAALLEIYTTQTALDVLLRLDVTTLSLDFRIAEVPLSHFLSDIQQRLLILTRLRDDKRVKDVLSRLSTNTDVSVTDGGSALQTLLAGEAADEYTATFLKHCHPSEIHQALIQVAFAETARYERSVAQLHQMVASLETGKPALGAATADALRHFTRTEIEGLARFVEQGHRLPLAELNTTLLTKIARHVPELYKQLEICFQKG